MGNIVNFLAIAIGGILGLIFKKLIKESYSKGIMNGIGLCVVLLGIESALETEYILVLIISIVIGTLLGEIIGLEEKFNDFGQYIGNKMRKISKGDNFSEGFVTTSLIYCIGAMSILGAIQLGLVGDSSTLYAKSILDGITAIFFASTLGIGVVFSSIPVFLYQGFIVLLAKELSPFFTDTLVTELSAVGGIIIIAIGLNILELKKIKIGNMLPAILGPIIYFLIVK
ncbi:MAG: DUF554 domain-containing protein [Andreesenia angusta]|nr:DUF554 domain-containing protein [Andreesenia angusta]